MSALTRDTALLVRLIRQVGKYELAFIVRSGAPFGLLLGTVQMVTWALTKNVWIMPAFGALTGLITDWLALQMIFRPIRPAVYFGVFRWQGLFHKRRQEVSRDYADLVANEILTPTNIIDGLLSGPNADKVFAVVGPAVQQAFDTHIGLMKPLVIVSIGGREYQNVKRDIADMTLARVHDISPDIEEFAVEAIDIRALMIEKMNELTDHEYEGLLRPAFKQDEWKVVLVGAVLGFLIAELQVHLLLT